MNSKSAYILIYTLLVILINPLYSQGGLFSIFIIKNKSKVSLKVEIADSPSEREKGL